MQVPLCFSGDRRRREVRWFSPGRGILRVLSSTQGPILAVGRSVGDSSLVTHSAFLPPSASTAMPLLSPYSIPSEYLENLHKVLFLGGWQ